MEQTFEFCADRVREADKDRFLATLFAPEPLRGPLFALYAFDAEISEVRDRITSPLPGEVRLQWWRDVLTGTEPGDAAANPIVLALREVVRRHALPVPALLDLIDAHTFDLYDDPMASVAALEAYAAATAGTVYRTAARILDEGRGSDCENACRHAGIATAIVALLQNFGVHAARGQRYLPDDLAARHGVPAEELHAGKASPQLSAALADLRALARDHLAALKQPDAAVPQRLLPAFLPVALAPLALAEMERPDADPFQPRTAPQWRRQWTLWRAARKPARFIAMRRDDPAGTAGRQ